MVWSELKRFIRDRECSEESEYEEAIREFNKLLTPQKCKRYIDILQKVNLGT